MSSMTNIRCCRFHGIFVLLLVLCAFSLTAHYFMDAVGTESGTGCQIQQTAENRTTSPTSSQRANMHGGFILKEIDDFCFQPDLWFRVENTKSVALAWKPPAAVRPPIFN